MTLRDIYLYREYSILEYQELINEDAIVEFFLQIQYKLRNFRNFNVDELDKEIEEFKDECELVGFMRMAILCEYFLKLEDEDLKEEILNLFDECYNDMKDEEIFSDLF